MENKTAVEWLIDYLKNLEKYPYKTIQELETQAKEMEKEQIIDAFWNGDNTDCTSEQNSKEFAENYYNETYKSE